MTVGELKKWLAEQNPPNDAQIVQPVHPDQYAPIKLLGLATAYENELGEWFDCREEDSDIPFPVAVLS